MSKKTNLPPSCREEFLRRAAKYDGEDKAEFTTLIASAINDFGIDTHQIECEFQIGGADWWADGKTFPVAPWRHDIVKQLAQWISKGTPGS